MRLVLAVLATAPAVVAVEPTPRVAVAWTSADGRGWVHGLRDASPWDVVTDSLLVGRHCVLRASGNTLYALSSDDATLTLIDVGAWAIDQVLDLGAGSQPVDIAVVDRHRSYLTSASSTWIQRLNPQSGAQLDVLDASPFADSDGNPDLGMLAIHDDRLFVQIRRLDNNGQPTQPLLGVMDLATETWIDVDPVQPGTQAIALQGTYPKGPMQVDAPGGRLFVSATGSYHDPGGIEMIDLATLQSLGFAVDEFEPNAGADVNAFVLTTPNSGYFSFSTDFAPSSHLHTFTLPANGDFGLELQTTLLYIVPRILHDPVTQVLYWPEGGVATPGVLVFDALTGAKLTAEPIPSGTDPSDIELLCGEPCTDVPVQRESWSRMKDRYRR